MKILFGAQGSVLRILCELDQRLRDNGVIDASAYWISDSEYYAVERANSPLLDDAAVRQLHEWNFTAAGAGGRIDDARRDDLERRYDAFELWNAVIADRRLMYGRVSKVRQAYAGHFDHQALCTILYASLDAIDRLVDEFAPDAVVTFVPATYGDYLLALVARARGIRYLQLRSTKIHNFVTFADSLDATVSHIASRYRDNLTRRTGYRFEREAIDFVDGAKAAPVDYEGTIARGRVSVLKRLPVLARGFLGALKRNLKRTDASADNHVPPPLRTWLHASALAGWRRATARRLMAWRRLPLNQAQHVDYVFYPMHSEPEIALSVYGRDHQNQIETVRRLAQSLPPRWKLVVKEHPRSVGYRHANYYRRLLAIPNVCFADSEERPFYWIQNARAVVTVSGFVGFEALMVGTPVIVLGDVAYSVLPDSMLRAVKEMSGASTQLRELLAGFRPDETALRAFVAACMEESVAVNLYSDLLAKPGRNSAGVGDGEAQYQALVSLLTSRLRDGEFRQPAAGAAVTTRLQ